jgi:hypothetical protein
MQDTTNRGRGRPTLRAAAIGLGVFSLGLGLAELLAPRRMARATGLDGRETLLQAYGLREIASGIALLAADDPAPWLWARVAGDALDVSTLVAAATSGSSQQAKHAVGAILAVSPVAMLDVATALLAQSRDDARRNAAWDYSDRSGFGAPVEQMRGAAADFAAPRDLRTPAPLRALEETT